MLEEELEELFLLEPLPHDPYSYDPRSCDPSCDPRSCDPSCDPLSGLEVTESAVCQMGGDLCLFVSHASYDCTSAGSSIGRSC